jgi:hypothetical protein
MLLAHLHRFVEQRLGRGCGLGGTAYIVGTQGGFSACGKPSHQVTHRAFTQVEFFSKLGHGGAFLPTLKERLPHGNRNGRRHG